MLDNKWNALKKLAGISVVAPVLSNSYVRSALSSIVLILIFSVFGTTSVYAGGLDFPFERTKSWEICRGYNTSGTTHAGNGRYALDFAIGTGHTSGNSGCSNYANRTKGEEILAPAAGVIKWNGSTNPDITCLKLNQAVSSGTGSVIKSLSMGHLQSGTDRKGVGSKASKGEKLGLACGANECSADGGYAHAHIKAHTDDSCTSANVTPFGSAFDGFNFTSDGSAFQWRKTVIPEGIQNDVLKLVAVKTNSPATYEKLTVRLFFRNNTDKKLTVEDIAFSFYPLDAEGAALNDTPVGKCYRTPEKDRGNVKVLDAGQSFTRLFSCNQKKDKPKSDSYKLAFKAKRLGEWQIFSYSVVDVVNNQNSLALKLSTPTPISKVVTLENMSISSIVSLLLDDNEPLVEEGPYGAIAYDNNDGGYGYTYGYDNKEDANDNALTFCQPYGLNCKIVATFGNTCAAMVYDGGYGFWIAKNGSPAIAETQALQMCNNSSSYCYRMLTICSDGSVVVEY